ncbi:MAG: hypothetical protein ACRD0K_07025 [Egibacteraceae bacterium]
MTVTPGAPDLKGCGGHAEHVDGLVAEFLGQVADLVIAGDGVREVGERLGERGVVDHRDRPPLPPRTT